MNRRVLELLSLTPLLLLHAAASSGLRGAKRGNPVAMDGALALGREEEGALAGGRLLVGLEQGGRDFVVGGENLHSGSSFHGRMLATTAASAVPCHRDAVKLEPVSPFF